MARATMDKYFAFQLMNVFVATILAGTIFDTLNAIVHNPASLLDLLGQSVPRVSSFFINYVMLKALSQLAWELLRPGAFLYAVLLLLLLFLLLLLRETERERQKKGVTERNAKMKIANIFWVQVSQTHSWMIVMSTCDSV